MKKFFKDLIICIILTIISVQVFHYFITGDPPNLSFAQDSYAFTKIGDDDTAYEYTNILEIPKRVSFNIDMDVIAKDISSFEPEGRWAIKLQVSDHDSFDSNSNYLEDFGLLNGDILVEKQDKSFHVHDYSGGLLTDHLHIEFELIDGKEIDIYSTVADKTLTDRKLKTYFDGGTIPETFYLRIGGKNVTVENVEISKITSYRLSYFWTCVIVAILILIVWPVLSGWPLRSLEDALVNDQYENILVALFSLPAGVFVILISEYFTDKLIVFVNEFNRELLTYDAFGHAAVQLPLLGTKAYWIVLAICAVLMIVLGCMIHSSVTWIGPLENFCGYVIQPLLAFIFILYWLVVILAFLKETLFLGIFLIPFFLGAGSYVTSGADVSHSKESTSDVQGYRFYGDTRDEHYITKQSESGNTALFSDENNNQFYGYKDAKGNYYDENGNMIEKR